MEESIIFVLEFDDDYQNRVTIDLDTGHFVIEWDNGDSYPDGPKWQIINDSVNDPEDYVERQTEFFRKLFCRLIEEVQIRTANNLRTGND